MPKTEQGLSFSRNKTYYRQPTHEFNIPSGWACPGAHDCLTKVDKDTGKRTQAGPGYVCYAAGAERYPNVRKQRWENYRIARELAKDPNAVIQLPKNADHVRIHASGDFFNPAYFRLWLRTAEANPNVKFWAFTKSINYLADYIDNGGEIPPNMEIQTSRGSKHDYLIDAYGFKAAEVFHDIKDIPVDMLIDYDDWFAQQPGRSFALLENKANRNQADNPDIAEHNRRARELQAAQGRQVPEL